MRWMSTSRELMELVSEQTAIKSGLLLTDSEIRQILASSEMSTWMEFLDIESNQVFLVRPEILQDMIRAVRFGIGNLPDLSWGMDTAGELMDQNAKEGIDNSAILDAVHELMGSWPKMELDGEFAEQVARKSGQPVIGVLNVLLGLANVQDRDDLRLPEIANLPEIKPLKELFSLEATPAGSSGEFLDQKYLDFLAKNTHRIDEIHWRNFERFTAEFFRREEYEVHLGPGSNDGGVDIRVWPRNQDADKPPLMLIQCKRLKKGASVAVQHVKALWTDVVFEGGTSGLIATTASVSPAGKKTVQARGYKLNFAESTEVKKWAQSMWRYPWDQKTVKPIIGTYLIPPLVPLPSPPLHLP